MSNNVMHTPTPVDGNSFPQPIMKSRRTQIISLIATIILVVGFVLVPTVKAFVSADSGASGAVLSAVGAATGNQAQVTAGTQMATAVASSSTGQDPNSCS